MFSVVVPTRGDPGRLEGLLAALEAQSLPRERFELLLALDGGALEPALATRVGALNGRVARLGQRRGPGAARNAAAALARFEWLAFTEDDCVPASDWLARAAERNRVETGLLPILDQKIFLLARSIHNMIHLTTN